MGANYLLLALALSAYSAVLTSAFVAPLQSRLLSADTKHATGGSRKRDMQMRYVAMNRYEETQSPITPWCAQLKGFLCVLR